jgi:large subunit ribosomal protein L37Ae
MAAKIKVGSVKRFGVRYGTKVRNKLGLVENVSKKNHKCPYCNSINVKKVSNGIFLCSKCKSKFTGKAYAPIKKVNPQELESEEPLIEAVPEEDNDDYSEEESNEEPVEEEKKGRKPKKKDEQDSYDDDSAPKNDETD